MIFCFCCCFVTFDGKKFLNCKLFDSFGLNRKRLALKCRTYSPLFLFYLPSIGLDLSAFPLRVFSSIVLYQLAICTYGANNQATRITCRRHNLSLQRFIALQQFGPGLYKSVEVQREEEKISIKTILTHQQMLVRIFNFHVCFPELPVLVQFLRELRGEKKINETAEKRQIHVLCICCMKRDPMAKETM